MKMKKVLAITVLLAALVILAACRQQQAPTPPAATPAPPAGNQQQPATPAPPTEPAEPEEPDRSERMLFTYAVVAPALAGLDYMACEIAQYFGEKFNVEWELIGLTWDNWAERLRIWINARDMPDLAMWDFNYGDFANYVDQGLIRRFPDGWEQRWPYLGQVFETSVIGPQLAERKGGAFLLPRIIYFDPPTDPILTHMNLYIRKDWANEVGFEIRDTYSPEDIIEFARLVRDLDPVGNNRTIPIDFSRGNYVHVFVSPFNPNASHFYRGADGRFTWGPASYGTLEGLRLYSQAFREGLINQDFFAQPGGVEITNFQTGMSGVNFPHGFGRGMRAMYDRFAEAHEGQDPREAVHMAVLVNPNDGFHHAREVTNFWTATIFSPRMEEDRFERLFDLMNYVGSEDGQNIIRMGFEGREWERDAAGNITIIRDVDEAGNFVNLDRLYESLGPIWNNLVILPDDFGLRDPGMDRDIIDAVRHGFDLKQQLGADQPGAIRLIDWDLFFFTSPAFDRVRFNFAEEYARLVTMDGDIEANWQNWIDEQMPMVQMVLDELNAAFVD